MFSKNPSKESLRQMLQAQCDTAMLLDNSVHKLYAPEQEPSKSPYRPKKPQVDAYRQELQRLAQAKESDAGGEQAVATSAAEGYADLDTHALEKEAAAFMLNRRRK